jgi:uncharacterized cupredoxin-like copper-binding protein
VRRQARSFVLVAALVAALVTGCSNVGTGSMMGAAPHGYRMTRLSCRAPSTLPGQNVFVMLGDMGMTRMMGGPAPLSAHMMLRAVPERVQSGQISFVVANMGWRTHEMVVLPLGPGQQAGGRVPGANGRVGETESPGEASASCAAGEGDGIRPGTVGWTTLDLPAGRYELVCNLRHHYEAGMHQLFVVRR